MSDPTHVSDSINNFVGGLECEHVEPGSGDLCGYTPCPNFSTDANIWWN